MERNSSDAMQELREQEILKQLTQLLRGYGEQILSGQSKLSLTTRSLCILNDSFATLLGEDELVTSFDVIPPNSPKLHLAQDIQFLYDFMQKTLALKILHVSSTLQGRVNLGPFKALRTLDIKKTPLHLLEGIQRMRGRLSTIICSRSLSSLQELFETCGGDLSSPMSWPELRTACLSFNMIEKLDSSLRLVPGLEVLDLSHNSIKDTDRCLEYLTEVSIVNLGYNKLVQVPTFAISTRAKLSTLILRNNNLEKLNGIDELVGLRDVDLSDNCLCEHIVLCPLKALHRLGVLVVKGNPLSYHDDHRLLTILQLNRVAASRVTLDGQVISKAEIQAAQKLAMSSVSKSPGYVSSDTMRSRGSHSSLDMSFESGPISDTERGQRSRRTRHSGRAARRARQAAISDLDSGCDAESDLPPATSDTSKPIDSLPCQRLTPMDLRMRISYVPRNDLSLLVEQQLIFILTASTPQVHEHLDVKKHMETMRNQLGPDWLQTLVHNRRQNAEATAVAATTQPLVEPSVPLPVSNRVKCPESDTSNVNQNNSPDEHKRVASFAIGSLNEESGEDEEILAGNYGNDFKPPPPVNYNYPQSHRNSRAGLVDNSDTLSDHIDLDETDKKTVTDATPGEHQTSALVKSAEFNTIYDKQRHQSHTDEVDYGVESEPFIVSHMSDSEIQHLISITQRYLLEKDINGDVIEALDLRCLQEAEVLALGAMAVDRLDADLSDDQDGRVIKLTFDHVRKDKRERLYVIEDEASCQSLQEMLQPIVDMNKTEANLRDQMQCLKCSREVSKQQCSRTIRRHGSVPSSDVYSTSFERGDLTEILLCPFCGSDLLIKVDSQRRRQSLIYTPVGSFKEPMATSSNNPSPWKRTESPINVPEKNQSAVGSFKSTQDASSFHSAVDTSTLVSPRDSMFMTPNTSQTDLTTGAHVNYNPFENDKPGPSTSSSADGRNSTPKTVYMSQSVIEVSSLHSDVNEAKAIENSSVTTPTENRAFQRNHSSHDLGSRYRKRQDSGNSDILILSHHPSLCTYPSQDSDITVLSNPSQSSIAVIDSAVCSRETLNELDADGHFLSHQRASINLEIVREAGDCLDSPRESDLSPAGSLTNKTLSSMVNSVYEKSIFDSDGISSGLANESEGGSCDDVLDEVTIVSKTERAGSLNSCESTPRALNSSTNPFTKHNGQPSDLDKENGNLNIREDLTPTPTNTPGSLLTGASLIAQCEDPGKMRFCYTDFSQTDHRLKLYLMMYVCTQENEELLLVNRCGLWHYAKSEEIAGLVIVSSHSIYFFKVTGPERVETPEKWMKLVQSLPIVDLCYVDIGLGHQTLRLEFSQDSTCFVLVMRDAARSKCFTSQFTAHVQSVASNPKSKLKGITKNNPATLENLRVQVLEAEEEDMEGEEQTMVCFIMAYQHTGEITSTGERKARPVSVIVTPTWLHLVDENLSLPAPRGTSVPKVQQFILKDRQRITDITHLDLYASAPLEVNLVFYDEQSSEECTWRVKMETLESLTAIVRAVKQLWDEQFGVDLLINNYEQHADQ